MALTQDRYIVQDCDGDYVASVKAAAMIYAGALIAQDTSGDAAPGSVSTTIRALGIAMEQVDNVLGGAGAKTVRYRKGVFAMKNSAAADEITDAQVDEVCYIVDDATVAKTSGVNTRSVAGKVRWLDTVTGLVHVEVGYVTNVDGDLVAANNLSDVATAATARSNIGANKVCLHFTKRASLDDSSDTLRIVSPVTGTISKIWSVIDGTCTTGDPTLTFSIAGTPITTGAITIAYSGSAAGDIDSCAPSAANAVTAGQIISCAVAANSQAADKYADISLLILT